LGWVGLEELGCLEPRFRSWLGWNLNPGNPVWRAGSEELPDQLARPSLARFLAPLEPQVWG
jgi:hypothetical protein